MAALKPSHVFQFILNALEAGEIPYVSGPPGIGKSDIYQQIADKLNLKLVDIRLSQMLPEDLTGLPSLDEKAGKARYVEFDTFPMTGDKVPDGYVGWLILLDELSSCTEEVMAAIYSLLLGGMVGGKPIHEMAFLCAAGNRSTDSAIARPLPDTLITRMLCVEMKVNIADWLKWAKGVSFGNATVIDYLGSAADQLISMVDHTKREELEAYPQPRGWGKVMKIINLHEQRAEKKCNGIRKDSNGIPIAKGSKAAINAGSPIQNDMKSLLNAAIGTSASRAFSEHYNETVQIPYPWDIAQSPSSAPIPSTQIGKAQVTSSCSEHFLKSFGQSRDALIQYMNRFDSEYSSLFVDQLKEGVGTTATDLKMIADVKERLNVVEMVQPKKDTDKKKKSVPQVV